VVTPFGDDTPYLTVPVGENLIRSSLGRSIEDSPWSSRRRCVRGDWALTIVPRVLDAIEANVISDATDLKKNNAQVRVVPQC
jgi:hypothetical protein